MINYRVLGGLLLDNEMINRSIFIVRIPQNFAFMNI